MTRTITFINQKGGTGKTTSTANIGAGLCRLGKKVLLIDFDPQANLTYHLGIKPQEINATISEVIRSRAEIGRAVIERSGLDVIPSSLSLAETEARIFTVKGREYLLKEVLSGLNRDYAYILVDCPPSLGLLTVNALVAVREVYIPLSVEVLPLQGLRAIQGVISVVRERLNPELRLTGIIATRFDGRKNLHREVLETIRKHFGELLFRTVIRENIRLAESPSYGKDIFSYAPKSHGAEDYLSLCREILRRGRT